MLFIGAKLFRLELYPCFSQLCKDPHVAVRKTIAAGFHEVCVFSRNLIFFVIFKICML